MATKNYDLPSMIVFDTETTGFNPGNICQLSYIAIDGESIRPGNFYFKVKYVEPGAEWVHGLSVNKLAKLSDNKRFLDYKDELIYEFSKADLLVAHNFDFDIRFLKTEFSRCGVNYVYNDNLCTMKYFTNICRIPKNVGYGYKWPKLEELINYFGIKDKLIRDKANELFGTDEIDYHDARFDTTATFLCLMEALDKGLIRFGVSTV